MKSLDTRRSAHAGADRKTSRPEIVRAQPSNLDATYIEPERRIAMIAEAAYYRAENRGFDPAHEIDDWLAAEAEIDAALQRGDAPTICGD